MEDTKILAIEKMALEVLQSMRKEIGLTESELGLKAFPGAKNSWSKVHAIWNCKTSEKKHLRLRLGDFCALCEAMDKDPAQELFSIWNRVNQKLL